MVSAPHGRHRTLVLRRRRTAHCLLVLALSLVPLARAHDAGAHPLHTTMSEVTLDPQRHVVRAVIRVFADDFSRASAGHARRARGSAATADVAYIKDAFQLSGADGRAIALRSCGTRRSGDLLWICVEGILDAAPSAIRLRNAMLCDIFDDQVNIVRAGTGGAMRSTLFTRGDGAKPLFQA